MIYDHDKGYYVVYLKSPAEKNKANKELIKLVSKHFGERVYIKRGVSSKIKTLEFWD